MAIFYSKRESVVVGNDDYIVMDLPVFHGERLGRQGDMIKTGEPQGIKEFDVKIDFLARRGQAFPQSLLDAVTPGVPPVVGVDIKNAVRFFRK